MMVLVLAIPSILLMCCVLEEAPLRSTGAFEEKPIWFGVWSTTDVFGQATGTLLCFFFVAITFIGFASLSAIWYMVWRGSVAWDPQGASLGDTMPDLAGAALIQSAT